jgi:hypothetical protein
MFDFANEADRRLRMDGKRPLREVQTFEEFISSIYERNAGPNLLSFWNCNGQLDGLPKTKLAELIRYVWALAEFPEEYLGQRKWVELFRKGGFSSDHAAPPTEALRVYRGCISRCVRHMAWSTEIEVARWFAARINLNGIGSVYTALIDPSAVLAIHIARGSVEQPDHELEVIVDPRHLRQVRQL